jgi:hypothetical protein
MELYDENVLQLHLSDICSFDRIEASDARRRVIRGTIGASSQHMESLACGMEAESLQSCCLKTASARRLSMRLLIIDSQGKKRGIYSQPTAGKFGKSDIFSALSDVREAVHSFDLMHFFDLQQ